MERTVNSFPIQRLPLSRKTEEWRKDCVDYIIGASGISSSANIPDEEELQSYYDLYNSIYNEKDLKYVTNPFNQDDGFPATTQDYNIIRPKIDLLLGEETKRPFNFRVCRTSEIASSEIQDKAKQMLLDYIQAAMLSKLSPEDQARYQEALASGEIQTPEEIQKYLTKDYKDIAEITAYQSLMYLLRKENISHEFMKGFKDALIGGLEQYYVGIRNGEPTIERVNPKDFKYPSEEGVEFIHDASWCCRRMLMSWSMIYDQFYDKLDEKQQNELLDIVDQKPTSGYGVDKNAIDDFVHINTKVYNKLPEHNPYGDVDNVIVYHVCWKSLKKIGFVTIEDPETGLPEEVQVDEFYKVTGNEINVEWKWIIEVWEGYRAGDDLYFGMQPLEYQFRTGENLNSAKLPYTGAAYSNTNSKAKSLVAIMKPLQYMYIILWYRLETAIARDKGKIPVIDLTQIPKSMGIDVDKWMHYLSALGVAFVNPYECFSPDTLVMLANGRLSKIKDLKIGDELMGPDGTSRKILATHKGVDNMYRLNVLTGGDDQVVNSKHKIYYKEKAYSKGEEITKLANPIELLKEDSKMHYKKNVRYLQRTNNVDKNWNSEVLLDPYILGLWLGDGSTNKAEFVSEDIEIINALTEFAERNQMAARVRTINGNNALNISLVNKDNIKGNAKYISKNKLKEVLRYYNIFNNKAIPEDYIYTSKENRLQLLAGLIDTDGYYSKRDKYYIFSQCESRKHIVDTTAFIARSLGFKCTVRSYKTNNKHILNSPNISICENTWVLNILDGDLEIPTRIARKKGSIQKTKGSALQSNFKISYEGIGEYCGITVDKDNLFVLGDFTIVHNCGWDIPGREGGRPATFNQWSSIDASMSNTISMYIDLLAKIEDMVSELSGVSKQRQGAISSNELVGNVERSVVQSAHITEPWFWLHNQIKKNVLSMLLDTAKYAWKDSKKYLNYIFDEGTRVFLQLDDNWSYEDFDVFVTDSTKENQAIEQLKSLIQPAMQNGASLLDAAEILTMDNLAMIKNKLQEIEQDRLEKQQAMQEQENQQQQQLVQMQNEVKEQELMLKEAELDLQKYKIDQDNATKITVAQLGAYRSAEDLDQDNNGIPDPIEIGKQEIERQRAYSDSQAKRMELMNKARSEENKKDLEKRKIDAQKESEKLRNQIEKEKIALEKRKLEEAKKLQKQKDDAAYKRELLKARTAIRNKVSGEK